MTGERPEVDDNDDNAANTAIEELDNDDEDEDEDEDVLNALFTETLGLEVDDCEDDDADDVSRIRSRLKGDIWRDYHPLPMQKKCPAKSIVLMLLIHATTEFVEKDLRPVQRYVQVKIHVEDWRWHFRFNSKWWRKCVRM